MPPASESGSTVEHSTHRDADKNKSTNMDSEVLEAAKRQAEIYKVFSNVNRVLIFWVLGNREMSVGDIASTINTSLQNTSQHLRLMKDKGILNSRRKGHVIYYRVNSERFHNAYPGLLVPLSKSGHEA